MHRSHVLNPTNFKEHAGLAAAIINTTRLIGSALLAIIIGYLLAQNINALPLGLISIGLVALTCSCNSIAYIKNPIPIPQRQSHRHKYKMVVLAGFI